MTATSGVLPGTLPPTNTSSIYIMVVDWIRYVVHQRLAACFLNALLSIITGSSTLPQSAVLVFRCSYYICQNKFLHSQNVCVADVFSKNTTNHRRPQASWGTTSVVFFRLYLLPVEGDSRSFLFHNNWECFQDRYRRIRWHEKRVAFGVVCYVCSWNKRDDGLNASPRATWSEH